MFYSFKGQAEVTKRFILVLGWKRKEIDKSKNRTEKKTDDWEKTEEKK